MPNTQGMLEHVPIKLENLDESCSVWKASTTTTTTATTTTSSASSTSSRTARLENEIESCGNVFIFNRRKLFLICGFCDNKYANMLQFAKHLNDCHKIFSTNEEDSNVASEAESDSDTSAVTGCFVKGGFQIRFVREGCSTVAEEMTSIPTPPPSVDDTLLKHVPIKVENQDTDDVTMVDDSSSFENNIESCGNIFVMNRRKLFLICGFCESKYANMELFAAHLHECHTIFQEDEDVIPEVKKEPEEVPVAVKRRATNNENSPPMVAIPNGTNVDNEDIIPQEEMLSLVALAAAKEKQTIDVTPQAEIMTMAVAAAAVAAAQEKQVLKETRNQRRRPVKTIKDYFCKEESPEQAVFTCKDCNKTFPKQSRLLEHIRLHTGEKPFKCDECGKTFRIKLRMAEHQLRHRTDKAYICELCGLGLSTRQDYSLHQRHHNGDKRYACKECGKAFVRSSDLRTHLRIHSDERPYKCEICNISFRANQNLIIHRRVHQGDKQFKCDYCDKKFLRKIDKRVHHRTHTGEKAFKCEICGRGYSAKVHVRRHIQKRHVDPLNRVSADQSGDKTKKTLKKSFKCDACPKTYSAKVTLQKHVKKIHGSASPSSLSSSVEADKASSSKSNLVEPEVATK